MNTEPFSNPRAFAGAMPDLDPTSAPLEWWFMQGFVEGASCGRRDFMVSFFRQTGEETDAPDGHMLLLASLDRQTGRHRFVSKVSPQLVENFNRDAPEEVQKAGGDRGIVSAILSEIAAAGPPRPISLSGDPAKIQSSPLSIAWEDFGFGQIDEALEISMALPGEAARCRLRAEPLVPWFEGRDLGGGHVGMMNYDCCPRLRLAGTLGEEPVSGQAWVDHQWGGYGWLSAPGDRNAILGWDWLGISLQDGRSLIVMVHRDMRSQESIGSFGVLFESDGETRLLGEVNVSGTRVWRSPSTMIDYPIACRIDVPALGAVLEYSPLSDDQEIPVFGLFNAIWEGAGTVSGIIDGAEVFGRARLELHGYGYMEKFETLQSKWIERIDRNIIEFLPKTLSGESLERYLGQPRWAFDHQAQNEMFAGPVWDLLDRGGKRWRPIFGLLLLDALGAPVEDYELMLSAIPELIHNGSVIVDDFEDSSLTRRGDETLHRRYGAPTAINAGNVLYFLPLLTIGENKHLSCAQSEEIHRLVTRTLVQAHFGQGQDLYWSKLDPQRSREVLTDPRTEHFILQVHAFKSAAAVRSTAEVACIIAGVDPETRAVCTRLAESWGVAFQIVDDINNFSTAQHWGKVTGEDVIEGKVTYVTYKAVQMLDGAAKSRLIEILITPELRRSEPGLAEALELIERSNALAVSRRDADRIYQRDWPPFSRQLPNSWSKFMLRAVLDKLLNTPTVT